MFFKYFLILSVVFFTSCSYFAPKKQNLQVQVDEKLRENVAAAKIATERAEIKMLETKVNIENTNFLGAKLSIEGALSANSISSVFLTRSQSLVGLPLEPQEKVINNLLSTNAAVRQAEERKQEIKENKEIDLRTKIEILEKKLLDYGIKEEQDRNEKIKFWTKWGILIFLVIGGGIALTIFIPPIAGLLVSLIPKLASVFGVVAKGTVKNIINGVGNARHFIKDEIIKAKELKEKGVEPKKFSAEEILNMLDTYLKIATDTKDKEIIEYLRKQNNL